MKKFEYKFVIHFLTTSELDKLGWDGWELVSYVKVITNGMIVTEYIFKRELKK